MNTQFIAIVLASLLSFSVGRIFGRVETTAVFNQRLQQILAAMRKVETLAHLRGEDLSKLSTEEIAYRTKKQLEMKGDD